MILVSDLISQQSKVNKLVNQINEASSQSRSDQSILGMINTSDSGASSTDLSTTNALIISLRVDLTETKITRQPRQPQRRDDKQGIGQYGGEDGGKGHGLGQREFGVLGKIMEDIDRRLTRPEEKQTVKEFKNKLYCHTHGYKYTEGHASLHCMWPENGHCKEATTEIQ